MRRSGILFAYFPAKPAKRRNAIDRFAARRLTKAHIFVNPQPSLSAHCMAQGGASAEIRARRPHLSEDLHSNGRGQSLRTSADCRRRLLCRGFGCCGVCRSADAAIRLRCLPFCRLPAADANTAGKPRYCLGAIRAACAAMFAPRGGLRAYAALFYRIRCEVKDPENASLKEENGYLAAACAAV